MRGSPSTRPPSLPTGRGLARPPARPSGRSAGAAPTPSLGIDGIGAGRRNSSPRRGGSSVRSAGSRGSPKESRDGRSGSTPPGSTPPSALRLPSGGSSSEGSLEASAAALSLHTASYCSSSARDNYSDSALSPVSTLAPMLGLLQAAPLVNAGQPVDMLDLKVERDTILASLSRAGRRVKVACDFCTTRRMRALLTDGCRMLHYSGHGFSYVDRGGQQRARLAFEDGLGGTHALEVEKLTALVAAGAEEGDGSTPLDFVFVSACHSDQGGQAFVAAGVPHVVAVRRDAQLQDKAACAFADQFYFALFKGKTVQQAFDIAKQAVSNDPSILRADFESDKFLLLPVHADHHVALCRDLPEGPVVDGGESAALCNLPAFFPLQFLGRQIEWQQLVAAAVGQEKRLLTLVGPKGMGKTSLALATAHYLYERATFPGGVIYVAAEGAANPAELSAMVLAALAEARTGYAEEEGYAEDADDSATSTLPSDSAATLPATLRRLGRCLVLIDQLELSTGSAGAAGLSSLLQSLLQKAPDLRLFLTCAEPITLPGVATRQLVLPPMAARQAARLFRTLSPRPLTREELGCDDPRALREELQRLLAELGKKLPGLQEFVLRTPGDTAGPPQPLRVQWRLPSLAAAAALQREIDSHSTLLQLDTPPISSSGHAALIGFLSLPRMLAHHSALVALQGNPRAISLAVSLLLPDAITPRPISEVGELLASLQNNLSAGGPTPQLPADLPEGCRAVLEQLQAVLQPEAPSPSRASPPPPDRSASASPPPPDAAAEAVAGQLSRQKLPNSLVLRNDEYVRMMERQPRWLGSGSLGAVYDVDLGGTRVAVKKFFESSCSSSAFQREAVLLADLRHPNIVQLIKVATRPTLCIVTELLVCSLHALLHHGAGGSLRPVLLAPGAQQLTLCMHVARGMNYLHTLDPPVLHRNLKSQNLLIDEGGKVKIADFGWSRLKTFDAGKTFFHGWQWVAPEILWGGRFTEAADVYSYSMVAWEVLTHELPFQGLNPVQIGLAVREQKRRPPVPDDCDPGFAQMLDASWHDQPEQRWSFAKVLGKMQALVAMSDC